MSYSWNQASQRFLNTPSQFVAQLPLLAPLTAINWLIDMVTGPPLEPSMNFWNTNSMTANVRNSFVLAVQDWGKFTYLGLNTTWAPEGPPLDLETAPTITSAYV
jgi:hypothetical protein